MNNQRKHFINKTLICGAAVVCTALFTVCSGSSDTKYEMYEYAGDVDAFQSVDINVSDCSVEFVKSDTYGVDLRFEVPEGQKPDQKVDGGTLVIKQSTKAKLVNVNTNNGNTEDQHVIVKLPEGEYDAITVNANNGQITMPFHGMKVNSIAADSNNGEISLSMDEKLADLSFEANANNGEIEINGEKHGHEFTNESGSIDVTLDSNNGMIRVETGD